MDEKERAKAISEMDQNARAIGDSIPPLAWSLYMGFQSEGFSEIQSFRLVRDYLIAMQRGATSDG